MEFILAFVILVQQVYFVFYIPWLVYGDRRVILEYMHLSQFFSWIPVSFNVENSIFYI